MAKSIKAWASGGKMRAVSWRQLRWAASQLRLALSFKPSTVRARARAKGTDRAPSEPSGSLAETGPFSFLVTIEIGSQVLLLSRGAPLALITRRHADLRTRLASTALNGYRVLLTPKDFVIESDKCTIVLGFMIRILLTFNSDY